MFFRSKKSSLKGVIDAFDAGILRGWIFNPLRPLESERFYIELNGKVVKKSVADDYRSDLERAGMGNGVHGFSVNLTSLPLNSGTNTLRLLDASKRAIRNTTKEIAVGELDLNCVFTQVEPYVLRFRLDTDNPRDHKERIFRFYLDGKLLFEYDSESALGEPFLDIYLPANVLDGKSHSLSLGVSGHPLALWSWDDFIADNLDLAPIFLDDHERLKSFSKKVLFVDAKLPTPNKDAGSIAAINELKIIKSLGYDVLFMSESRNSDPQHLTVLRELGVELIPITYYVPLENLVESVLKYTGSDFELTYINRFSIAERLLPLIRKENLDIRVVLNLADLHFLREMRSGLSSGCKAKLDQAKDTKKRELDVISKVDAVLTYTREEKAVISSHLFQQENIHICPWVLEKRQNKRSFEFREGVAFIGGYSHEPNLEALEYIINVIAPKLCLVKPDITFYVYGSNLPSQYKDYVIPNVKFIGYVDDVAELYDIHKVFIAPLQSGAGIKGKVLESISYGLPTILSDIATEGINVIDNVNSLIANSGEEWVSQITRLYQDKKLWQVISNNQAEMLEHHFSFGNAKRKMEKIFNGLNKERK